MDSINCFIHPLCQVTGTGHVNKGYGFNSFGKTNNLHIQIYVQGVSGGIENILEGDSMDYSK